MKISALIFARLNSSRLKNKALIKINDKTILEKVIENTKKIKKLDKIILATTKLKQDRELIKIAKKMNIDYFAGHNHNVLKRTLDCLKKYKIDQFLRVCGDRFFYDYSKINSILKFKKNLKNFDLITSNLYQNVDQGLTIEIISSQAIEKIYQNHKISNYDKEHITNSFYKFKQKYRIYNLNLPKYYFNKLKYTIDTNNDLKRTKFILRNIKNNNFSEIIKMNKLWIKNEKRNFS